MTARRNRDTDMTPPSEEFKAHIHAGDIALRSGDVKTAKEHYKAAGRIQAARETEHPIQIDARGGQFYIGPSGVKIYVNK